MTNDWTFTIISLNYTEKNPSQNYGKCHKMSRFLLFFLYTILNTISGFQIIPFFIASNKSICRNDFFMYSAQAEFQTYKIDFRLLSVSTRYACFGMNPNNFRRLEIADWVNSNIFTSFSCVCHESSSSNVSKSPF